MAYVRPGVFDLNALDNENPFADVDAIGGREGAGVVLGCAP